jgi:hypothetical protein
MNHLSLCEVTQWRGQFISKASVNLLLRIQNNMKQIQVLYVIIELKKLTSWIINDSNIGGTLVPLFFLLNIDQKLTRSMIAVFIEKDWNIYFATKRLLHATPLDLMSNIELVANHMINIFKVTVNLVLHNVT